MSDSSSDAEMQQPQRPDNSSSKREKVDEVADDQSSNDSDNGRGSSDSGSSDSNDDEEENEDGNGSHSEEEEQEEHEEHEGEDAGEGRDSIVGGQPQPEHPETRKKQGAKKVKISASEAAKRGVVYISRPPPYMRPDKVRHLLQQYAEVTRIYLAPEDETVRRRRRKQGGNRKMRFVIIQDGPKNRQRVSCNAMLTVRDFTAGVTRLTKTRFDYLAHGDLLCVPAGTPKGGSSLQIESRQSVLWHS